MSPTVIPRTKEVKDLVRAFVQEANAGLYPKLANAAAHAQMDQVMEDALGYDLNAVIKVRKPFIIRMLDWFQSFSCPPIDSRNPNRLEEIDDFLSCATPLASGTEFHRHGPTNAECEMLCNALAQEIAQDSNWETVPILSAHQIGQLSGADELLCDLMTSVYALFQHIKYGDHIALIRTANTNVDFGDEAKPDGVEYETHSFSIAYIPQPEAKYLKPFIEAPL